MNYNFDEHIERRGTNCTKFDALQERFGCRGQSLKDGIVPLWIADMDFPVAEGISDALKKRAEHPVFGYNVMKEGYFAPFIAWQKKRWGWQPEESWLTHTPGVLSALCSAMLAFTEKGDGILVQPPVYHPFKMMTNALNRRIVFNQLIYRNGRFTMDFDDLDKKLAEAKIFVFCSPHNPSGRVWTHEELTKVEELCRKHGVLVFSDEIHSDIVFGDNKHTPFVTLSDWAKQNCILAMAPSKTFNIPGLAMSVITVPNDERRAAFRLLLSDGMHVGGANSFGLVAARAAYETGEEWYGQMMKYVSGNVDFVDAELKKRDLGVRLVRPEATYIPLLDFRSLIIKRRSLMTQENLKDFMLNEVGAALNSGDIFGPGGEGFMRINLGTQRAVLADFIDRLEKAIKN